MGIYAKRSTNGAFPYGFYSNRISDSIGGRIGNRGCLFFTLEEITRGEDELGRVLTFNMGFEIKIPNNKEERFFP
jgi:hypothetical protein